MLSQIKKWFVIQRKKTAITQQAITQFRKIYHREAVGGTILHVGDNETVVRVMYLANSKPPKRAWFSVSQDCEVIRELRVEEVSQFEAPWR